MNEFIDCLQWWRWISLGQMTNTLSPSESTLTTHFAVSESTRRSFVSSSMTFPVRVEYSSVFSAASLFAAPIHCKHYPYWFVSFTLISFGRKKKIILLKYYVSFRISPADLEDDIFVVVMAQQFMQFIHIIIRSNWQIQQMWMEIVHLETISSRGHKVRRE